MFLARFHWKLVNLTRSLPEVLHYQDDITTLLLEQIVAVPIEDVSTYIKLIQAFGRDIQDDLSKHFHKIFKVLASLIDSVSMSSLQSPEIAGQIIETLSFLLK